MAAQLPTEILRYVFEEIRRDSPNPTEPFSDGSEGQRALRYSSLASRRFRALAQPVLFHRIYLVKDLYWQQGRSNLKLRIQNLLELLEIRPESRSWFKDVTIGIAEPCGAVQRIDYTAAQSELKHLLTQFALSLDGVIRLEWFAEVLPYAIYHKLHHTRTLRELVLLNLSSMDDVSPDMIEGEPTGICALKLTLKHINFTPHGPSIISYISPVQRQVFQKLTLMPSITHLDTELDIIDPLPPFDGDARSPYSGLYYLKLSLMNVAEALRLPHVLSACSRLTILIIDQHIPSLAELSSAGIIIPQTTVPLLEEVSAASCYVEALVPGRPARKVVIRYPDIYHEGAPIAEEDILKLARGSADLIELEMDAVRWGDKSLLHIIKLLPNLESLIIRSPFEFNYMNALQTIVRDGLVLPRLRRLQLNTPNLLRKMFPDHVSPHPRLPRIHTFDHLDFRLPEPVAIEGVFAVRDELAVRFNNAIIDWLKTSSTSFPCLTSVQFEDHHWKRRDEEDSRASWSEVTGLPEGSLYT